MPNAIATPTCNDMREIPKGHKFIVLCANAPEALLNLDLLDRAGLVVDPWGRTMYDYVKNSILGSSGPGAKYTLAVWPPPIGRTLFRWNTVDEGCPWMITYDTLRKHIAPNED